MHPEFSSNTATSTSECNGHKYVTVSIITAFRTRMQAVAALARGQNEIFIRFGRKSPRQAGFKGSQAEIHIPQSANPTPDSVRRCPPRGDSSAPGDRKYPTAPPLRQIIAPRTRCTCQKQLKVRIESPQLARNAAISITHGSSYLRFHFSRSRYLCSINVRELLRATHSKRKERICRQNSSDSLSSSAPSPSSSPPRLPARSAAHNQAIGGRIRGQHLPGPAAFRLHGHPMRPRWFPVPASTFVPCPFWAPSSPVDAAPRRRVNAPQIGHPPQNRPTVGGHRESGHRVEVTETGRPHRHSITPGRMASARIDSFR